MKDYQSMKKIVAYILFGAITLLPGCGGGDDPKVCPDARCANYTTQEQAQAAYDADPQCMDELDNDNDKIACEELASGGGPGPGCPTTANCGCSGKNKDNCVSSCCKWVVGDGCKCK
jgi:hypothetical protein